jgi:hypothetical protein
LATDVPPNFITRTGIPASLLGEFGQHLRRYACKGKGR